MPEETPGPHFLPALAVSGLGLLLSVYFLILCVCGKNKEKKEEKKEETARLRNGTDSQVNSIAINVDDSVTVVQSPTANGHNRYSGGSPKGGSSPHPPGTNHRELPQPPTSSRNTIGGRANPFQGDVRNKRNTIGEAGLTEDQDDYDHLMRQGFQKNNLRRSNYDHIQLGEDGQFHVQARKADAPATEEMPENDYAEVERENIYEGVKDKQPETETKVQAPASSMVKKPYDPYSSVNDDEDDSGDIEPEKKPYDPYSKLKGDSNSGSFKKKSETEENVSANSQVKKKEYDPYSSVKDGDSNSGSFTTKPYDPYARVKDDKDESSGGTFKDIDPYSTVKEERTPRGKGKDDPYTKVKDMARNDLPVDEIEDPYNKVVDDPYNKVKGDDPYNKVKGDDPYNKVKGDDPYNKMKEDDPYNTVKGDDPYNKVKDEEPEDPYNSVDEDEGSPEGAEGQTHDRPTSYQYSTVNKVNQELKGGGFSVVGEYAQVIKNKDSEVNANRPLPTPAANLTQRETDPYQLPPEPPRRYQEDYSEEGSQSGVSHSTNGHTTVTSGGAMGGNGATAGTGAPAAAATSNTGSTATEPTKHKEPPYHKLTARESMASINARRALNTYEEVPDKENMYATVEGGSGDGVVTSRGAAQNSLRPIRQELYEEIPNGDQLPAPAPPSLDTLHLMTEGKSRLSGDPEGSNRSSYSESQKSPGGTTSPRYSTGSTEAAAVGMINPAFDGDPDSMGISLDPNYTTVRDCIPDRQVEGDPNYESVEEVKSKVQEVEEEKQRQAMRERKKRLHVYEEVGEGETNPVKERVLRGHMYEDLDGVKTQKQELNKNEEDRKDSDVWKRRSDVFSEKL